MKSRSLIKNLLAGRKISQQEALDITLIEDAELFDFFSVTNRLRKRHSGNHIKLCSIINAKCGKCPEDCSFCAQSSHYKTETESWPLVSSERMLEAALEARQSGATEFSIVTSGYGIESDAEISGVEEGIKAVIQEARMLACTSPGIVDKKTLLRFKRAGLSFYHHNLETARSFFPNVCSTHDYEEDVEAIRLAKSLGLKVCCGGIFGLGESWEHRVELLMTLRELDVDSVPINFLNPIKGTPMEGRADLKPLDCLKIIALARAILPDKDITVCGGREVNLRDLQVLMFFAGANGTMAGNYLTTKGRPASEDLQMITDAGLEIEK